MESQSFIQAKNCSIELPPCLDVEIELEGGEGLTVHCDVEHGALEDHPVLNFHHDYFQS